MNKSMITAWFLVSIFSASAFSASSEFIEPVTDVEWKAFCESPKYVERLKVIKDKKQRQKVAATCLRAPWQKFKASHSREW